MTLLDLTRQDWSAFLDEGAAWQQDDISALERLPEREPAGGWATLERGRPISIPASTYDLEPDYHGVSWWSTEVDLAAGPAILHFLGARLLAEVYLDRRRIHADLEGMTPFSLRIPAEFGRGRHRLDLRVTDPGGGSSWMDWEPIAWGPHRLPASHGFGGPWLPVRLEQPGPVRVAGLWARAGSDLRTALVDFDLEAQGPRRLRVELVGREGGAGETELACAPGHVSLSVPLTRVAAYGPGHPNLHAVRVMDGDALLAESSFGLRVLDFDGSVLRLNGEPFRLATSISWGWYRRGPVPSEGDCRREAQSVRAFGMNALSAHRHLSTLELQDALEEQGLLLYQEPGGLASTIVESLDDRQRAQVEELSMTRLRRLARRDRGRACLAWWNLANEVMGPYLERHDEYFTAAARALREEDGSRLVTVTSGWGPSAMWRPFDAERRSAWDWHRVFAWPSAWHDLAEAEVARYLPETAGLAIDGESACFGGLGRVTEIRDSFAGLPPAGGNRAWAGWVQRLEEGLRRADPEGRLGGVDGLAGGTAAVQAHAVARLVEAHRRLPGLHGLAINGWHQHHRVGTSGIVAPDRSPVVDTEPIRRANGARGLAFARLARTLRRGGELRLDVELLGGPGEPPRAVEAELEVLLGGRSVWSGRSPASPVLAQPGLYLVRAADGDLLVEDLALAVDPGPPPAGDIAVYEDEPLLEAWLSARGVRAVPWRIGDGLPVLSCGLPLDPIPPARRPVRMATIHRPFGAGARPLGFVHRGVSSFEPRAGDDPAWMDVQGAWVGGWALSGSDRLAGLGPPGVWGAERADLYPRLANRQAPGSWLSAAVSFPQATQFEIGLPAVGATTWLWREGGTEFLTTVLPVVERRDHPLGEALLMDFARWLAGG